MRSRLDEHLSSVDRTRPPVRGNPFNLDRRQRRKQSFNTRGKRRDWKSCISHWRCAFVNSISISVSGGEYGAKARLPLLHKLFDDRSLTLITYDSVRHVSSVATLADRCRQPSPPDNAAQVVEWPCPPVPLQQFAKDQWPARQPPHSGW